MNRLVLGLPIIALLVSPDAVVAAQTPATGASEMTCPMHQHQAKPDAHRAAVEAHGDQAMGFPHDKTTHHFRLADSGGTIEVTANDTADKFNIEAIRSHLTHIATIFGNGDFSTPMFVHDSVPPGVTTMRLLKDKIRFSYESISAGGLVRIESNDPIALAAVHDFLRFQISDHQTGDPMVIENIR